MKREQYYKAPTDDIFNDIKDNAIKLWQTMGNVGGYSDEKINRIKDIKNISDNAWFIVAMFDYQNQDKLLSKVSEKTQALIRDARGY